MVKVTDGHGVLGTHHLWGEPGDHWGPVLLAGLAGQWGEYGHQGVWVGGGDHTDSQLAQVSIKLGRKAQAGGCETDTKRKSHRWARPVLRSRNRCQRWPPSQCKGIRLCFLQAGGPDPFTFKKWTRYVGQREDGKLTFPLKFLSPFYNVRWVFTCVIFLAT